MLPNNGIKYIKIAMFKGRCKRIWSVDRSLLYLIKGTQVKFLNQPNTLLIFFKKKTYYTNFLLSLRQDIYYQNKKIIDLKNLLLGFLKLNDIVLA